MMRGGGRRLLYFALLTLVLVGLLGGVMPRWLRAARERRFIKAAGSGNIRVVRALLGEGIHINAQDDGDTALLAAAAAGHEDLVRLLLDHSANPNVSNEYGYTPLSSATHHGYPRIIALLLKRGANPDPASVYGETPLMSAAMNGRLDIVRLLLRAGANPCLWDSRGRTAHNHALSFGKTQVAAVLRQAEKKALRRLPH